MKQEDGVSIAGLGISGAGKSSVLSALSAMLKCTFFAEPEDNVWPPAVTEWDLNGCFATLSPYSLYHHKKETKGI